VRKTALRPDGYKARTREGETQYRFERELAGQEQLANSVIRKVRSFSRIDFNDKSVLADYIFLTAKRLTARDDEMLPKMREALAEETAECAREVLRLAEFGEFAKASQLQRELEYWKSQDAETFFLRRTMTRQVGLVHRALLAKPWQFVKAPPEGFFVTNDNPVVFDRRLGLERATLLFPLSRNVILITNDSRGEDLVYRDATVAEVQKLNTVIIISARREIYSPRPDEWIHKMWTKGFNFYS